MTATPRDRIRSDWHVILTFMLVLEAYLLMRFGDLPWMVNFFKKVIRASQYLWEGIMKLALKVVSLLSNLLRPISWILKRIRDLI
jgi:hypothetical protein